MRARKRKAQIRQRQLRRRKNVSFRQLSVAERKKVAGQERRARADRWRSIKEPLDSDSLLEVEGWHSIKFKPILKKLRSRFQGEKIEVLDEGAGRSSLKHELMQPEFGGNLQVTTTDVRQGNGWPDKRVNVMNLVKEFGKNRFHLVVSTVGGGTYTPLGEKAIFQMVSVLKPGGIGIVSTNIPDKKLVQVREDRLAQLAKRFNITVRKRHADSVVFSKNFGRKKKR